MSIFSIILTIQLFLSRKINSKKIFIFFIILHKSLISYNILQFNILIRLLLIFHLTPLFAATEQGNKHIVELLLSKPNIDISLNSI